MKKNVLILLLLGLLIPGTRVMAQETPSSVTLTLQQAVDYALKHSRDIESAKYDVDISEKTVWETIASGLPHVNGSASLDDNLKLMTTLIPAEMFGGPAGTYIPVTFGSKYNSSYGATATTSIFNATYLIGIQTAKLASKISETQLKRTELDVKQNVMSTYYMILVSKELLKVLNANLANMNEILESTKASVRVGMAEATDADQMASNISFLENSVLAMGRTLEYDYNLMRLQLGLAPGTEFVMTDSIESIVNSINVDQLLASEFRLENNLDYQLLENSVKMSELGLKSAKASTLPSLSGSVYYLQTGQGNKLGSMEWYPYSVAGLQLSVPIFGFGERNSKIQKARLSLMKSQNEKESVSETLTISEKQVRFNLINTTEQFKSQKNNIEIAGRILLSVQNKFKQGMVSSLDLTQANDNYLSAQSAYFTALQNLLMSKLAYDKLLNQL